MNGISYKGSVTLKSTDGFSIELFNTGTALLGSTICRALAGYDISNALPTYLDIQSKQNDGSWVSLLNRKLPFTGIKYSTIDSELSDDSAIGELQLNSVVLFSDKKRTAVSESEQCRLVLYSRDHQVLAHVSQLGDISDDTANKFDISKAVSAMYNNITNGVDCVVNWVMSFCNK